MRQYPLLLLIILSLKGLVVYSFRKHSVDSHWLKEVVYKSVQVKS